MRKKKRNIDIQQPPPPSKYGNISRPSRTLPPANLLPHPHGLSSNISILDQHHHHGPNLIPSPPPPPPRAPKPQRSRKRGRKRKRKNDTQKSSGAPPRKKRRVNKVRGLRFFSKLVLEKVREKQKTTYNEVANSLVEEHAISSGSERTQEEKNIRRRVYDALNVLVALDIITKNRKEIVWKGYPMNFQHEYENLIKQREQMNLVVEGKKRQVKELESQKSALEELYSRNKEEKFKSTDTGYRVDLPFIIVHTGKNTVIECQMDSTAQEVFFNFSQPFEIHDDNEILQRIFDPKNKEILQKRRKKRQIDLKEDENDIIMTTTTTTTTTPIMRKIAKPLSSKIVKNNNVMPPPPSIPPLPPILEEEKEEKNN